MTVCHLPENSTKNRYRDISPYDKTRVMLKDCPSGNYINANHVNMTVPGSGVVNRYVATQGPLSGTSGDFWYMTWETQADLVVMLTTIVERGRVKCHKYWPDRDEVLDLGGGLRVKCVYEEDRAAKKNKKDKKKRKKKKENDNNDDDNEDSSEDSSNSSTESDTMTETGHPTFAYRYRDSLRVTCSVHANVLLNCV